MNVIRLSTVSSNCFEAKSEEAVKNKLQAWNKCDEGDETANGARELATVVQIFGHRKLWKITRSSRLDSTPNKAAVEWIVLRNVEKAEPAGDSEKDLEGSSSLKLNKVTTNKGDVDNGIDGEAVVPPSELVSKSRN